MTTACQLLSLGIPFFRQSLNLRTCIVAGYSWRRVLKFLGYQFSTTFLGFMCISMAVTAISMLFYNDDIRLALWNNIFLDYVYTFWVKYARIGVMGVTWLDTD